MTIKISIDCMGGDHGPSVTIPAAVSFLKRESDAELILVGLEDVIRAELKKLHADAHPRITVQHASEQVTMDDPLEVALRRKKDSSMRVAIEQVKDGKAQACVSAGNTGALMAVSRYVLKTMTGVDRPAICGIMPNQKNGPTYMLDLGANVDCEPHHLHQFAIMGSVLVAAMEKIERPTIGLLNVGTEDIKGNEVVKATSKLLQADHERGALNFYGNVEGNDIFKGTTDIVVCDGFVGNVTLKAVEGVARFFGDTLRTEFKRNLLTMLGALLGRGALKAVKDRFQPSRHNGASLLGLRGLVFKSHGGADAYSFEWAIRRAYDAAKNDVLGHISEMIAELMPRSTDTPEVPSSTI
ncbi:phosphate acyltransferase PlsX [Duganella violaceipulchra]|uniref:Phosphate acyltransferase n=1 Tax=Duganella violaceipulchra TaxID=2849652 RepID=A0AA41HIX3_9BURK|nr:phosphate acyltransferase PlsX [Duganella violaceicalia]MBV6325011.1 phosphate acyltransferase PlsX [Duganella violaceicalia]MCP2009190.1 glycerol-3-phosphate acyltransferase PlsX [Duganella violaceicalia]